MRSGSRAADARRQEGQIKAGMIQGLGQIAGGTLRDIAERKAREPILQEEADVRASTLERNNLAIDKSRMDIGTAQRNQATEDRRRTAMSLPHRQEIFAALRDDPEGIKIATETFSRIDDFNDSMLGEVASGILRSGKSPQAIAAGFADLEAKGYDPAKLAEYKQQMSDPTAVDGILFGLLENSPDPKHRAIFEQIQDQSNNDRTFEQNKRNADRTFSLAETRERNDQEYRNKALGLQRETIQATRGAKEAALSAEGRAASSELEYGVSNLLSGSTADQLGVGVRQAAVAEAKARGGIEGTGFVPMNAGQQKDFSNFMDLRSKAVRLKTLMEEHPEEIAKLLGPIMGRANDLTKELPFIGQPTYIKEAFDLYKDLSDTELRKRSGAAISPNEYERITGFTVSPTKQYDSNMTNLNRLLGAINNNLGILGATFPEPKPGGDHDSQGLMKSGIVRDPSDGTYSRRQ